MTGLDCGIDIGSTNLKLVLSDEEGRAVHTRAVPTPRAPDGAGVATDAIGLVRLLESMIVEGWREAGRGQPLRTITAAGIGEDGVGVTEELRPTGLALPWFDGRAVEEARTLRNAPVETVLAGIAVAPDRTAAKWLWLRRHRPEELRAARYWIALTDFPAVRWTSRPFMSSTLAPRTACFDVYGRTWIEPLLEAAGAPPLPPLLNAGAVVGAMTPGPLRESGAASMNTLVVAGGHDHPVAASAIRRIDPVARIDSMGTANLVYGEAPGPKAPYFDPFMAFSLPPLSASGLACLGVMELSEALAPARTDAVLFHSILDGERIPGAPCETPADRNNAPSGQALIRLTLEQAAFQARRMFLAMDEAGAPPGPIYATGGWARSRAFLELRASVFGVPVHVIEEPELTAIGAAYLGAAAASGSSPRLQATRGVHVVDPVADWTVAYGNRFPEIRRRLDAAAKLLSKQPEPARRISHGRH
jgi:xylulokinase